MLYVIAEQLGFPGLLNLIRYISFRAGGAGARAKIILREIRAKIKD